MADTFANSYLPLTATRAGAAARRAALNKHTKYDHLKTPTISSHSRARSPVHGVLKVLHSSMTSLRESMMSLVIKERSRIYFRGSLLPYKEAMLLAFNVVFRKLLTF